MRQEIEAMAWCRDNFFTYHRESHALYQIQHPSHDLIDDEQTYVAYKIVISSEKCFSLSFMDSLKTLHNIFSVMLSYIIKCSKRNAVLKFPI